jgi:hypothetical protein
MQSLNVGLAAGQGEVPDGENETGKKEEFPGFM